MWDLSQTKHPLVSCPCTYSGYSIYLLVTALWWVQVEEQFDTRRFSWKIWFSFVKSKYELKWLMKGTVIGLMVLKKQTVQEHHMSSPVVCCEVQAAQIIPWIRIY